MCFSYRYWRPLNVRKIDQSVSRLFQKLEPFCRITSFNHGIIRNCSRISQIPSYFFFFQFLLLYPLIQKLIQKIIGVKKNTTLKM
ncbi:hypothetical protein NEF87_003130 [Candidatus Lokiarchaeum ossiferum]|uniref:Uncharacterized protein n=1 Tax=Candidatus Lokiarchaeum ossiferum TaxID=2951803 RepID=A0ABY6HTJ8_9ARCH|nr:hypothetical protein NEF87_003130 [Candidatus Lokiarchaeum sp. B-35]